MDGNLAVYSAYAFHFQRVYNVSGERGRCRVPGLCGYFPYIFGQEQGCLSELCERKRGISAMTSADENQEKLW